jgi:hypothetical protein
MRRTPNSRTLAPLGQRRMLDQHDRQAARLVRGQIHITDRRAYSANLVRKPATDANLDTIASHRFDRPSHRTITSPSSTSEP